MLNAQIGAKKSWNGQYLVDCSKVPELPELSFYFGGKAYPLKGSDYVLEVQGTCISSFTPMNLPKGLWIIGTSKSDLDQPDVYRGRFPSPLLYSLRSRA
jgi:saccharopepsin